MDNLTVAHEWASQQKESGKGSNFYYKGKTIYSYGAHFPIATWYDSKTIFFTTRDYSSTTATHKCRVRQAIPEETTIFHVPNVVHYGRTAQNTLIYAHGDNTRALLAKVYDSRHYLRYSRSRTAYIFAQLELHAEHLTQYYTRFKRHAGMDLKPAERKKIRAAIASKLLSDQEKESIQNRILKYEERERLRTEEINKALRAQAEEAKPYLEQWKNGANIQNPQFWQLPCALRIIKKENSLDEIVQTSHGAEVPLLHAIKLLGAWQANTVEEGNRIGLYTVKSVTPDEITIGCHKISRTEAERVLIPIMRQS